MEQHCRRQPVPGRVGQQQRLSHGGVGKGAHARPPPTCSGARPSKLARLCQRAWCCAARPACVLLRFVLPRGAQVTVSGWPNAANLVARDRSCSNVVVGYDLQILTGAWCGCTRSLKGSGGGASGLGLSADCVPSQAGSCLRTRTARRHLVRVEQPAAHGAVRQPVPAHGQLDLPRLARRRHAIPVSVDAACLMRPSFHASVGGAGCARACVLLVACVGS